MTGRKDDAHKLRVDLIAHDVVVQDEHTSWSPAFYAARLREWWQGGSTLPALALAREDFEGVTRILEFGAKKYADRNWEGGIAYGRVFAAAMRHYGQLGSNDAETGLPHLHHFLCCYMFLAAYTARGMHVFDNRPRTQQVVSVETAEGMTRIAVAARESELRREFAAERSAECWACWKNGVRAGRNSFGEPIETIDPQGNQVTV